MAPIGSNRLKQGTLSFTTTKRTASTSTAGKQKKAVKSVVATTPERSSSSSGSERSGASTPVIDDSGSRFAKRQQEEEAPRTLRPAKRRHVSPSPEVVTAPPREDEGQDDRMKEERPSLNPKDKRWTKLHTAAKKRTENATLVLSDNQNRIHEILRVFDLSYEYGPCIGVSRLERWERARALGLNPPEEIRDILNTMEGTEKSEYSQCVFHDLV